jgi:hypothetical protein
VIVYIVDKFTGPHMSANDHTGDGASARRKRHRPSTPIQTGNPEMQTGKMLPKEIEDMIDPEKMKEDIARNLLISDRIAIKKRNKS